MILFYLKVVLFLSTSIEIFDIINKNFAALVLGHFFTLIFFCTTNTFSTLLLLRPYMFQFQVWKIYFKFDFNMTKDILREITPLTQGDCFTHFSRIKSDFDFPLHYHEEFELNFIKNAKGAQRMIGDHIGEIDELELILVGPNLQHAWFTHKCKSK